jgi:hypothetical protein
MIPEVGLKALLTARATLAESRVFVDEIPPGETASMSRKCIVIEPSGPSVLGGAFQEYGDGRYDIRCYGETPYEAARLQAQVYQVMKHLQRETHAGVLIHWARRSGGPIPLRDPDTDWPFRFESYQVLIAEVEVV